MNHPREALADFLVTRRGRVTPDQAGLPVYGANRRVSGLRREEVALLAGISVEYYTRLKRGHAGSISESVLDGLVHALLLDEAERDHLFDLARTATAREPVRRAPAKRQARPTIQRMLDHMDMPAYLRNGRFDVLAANDLGRALYSPMYDHARAEGRGAVPNSARFAFLAPESAAEFWVDFAKIEADCVAFLRIEAGRDPYDKELTELVGELSTRSERFRQLWAAHDVRHHRAGTKRFQHPLVGDLTLDFEAFDLPGDDGRRLNLYSAPPDTPSAEALALLASWIAREPAHLTSEDR